jgi:hypothetical protein
MLVEPTSGECAFTGQLEAALQSVQCLLEETQTQHEESKREISSKDELLAKEKVWNVAHVKAVQPDHFHS